MNLTLWPGKRLGLAEEAWLRNRVASLQRAEDARADGCPTWTRASRSPSRHDPTGTCRSAYSASLISPSSRSRLAAG
jgi:hypothetical protein